ncbi:MAG: trimethylamine methyltransferase family protein [Pseudomonadota bacterium]
MPDISTSTQKARKRRSGGRTKKQSDPDDLVQKRAPYIHRKIGTYNILDNEGLELIEHNADLVLQETGMDFTDDPEILSIFREAGADVTGTRVRFEPGMCRSIIQQTAPAEFKQHARNPDNTVVLGGDNAVLCPSWGPPFVSDLDRGRRYGTLDDFQTLVKLHQTIPYLHHSGGVVCEPVDLPANKRHLDMLYAHFRYSDRACFGALIGAERAQDSINMAKIVFGDDFVENNAVLYCVSNTNAPLVLDANMSGALKTYARSNQPVACTPWTLAGAMSPCTVTGTLTQVLAEALACLCLVQLINPGAPCLMGSFASTMSMQSGAPTFGTPEAAKMVLASGQLARRLGVPLHTVGTLSASKAPDAQSEQEATWGLLMAMFAGANLINHATGWLEGGLVTSFEKTIIDADLCGKVASFFEGIDLSSNAQAMDAIAAVGPGQHYLSSDHTQRNFRDAFYRSESSDSNAYEQWVADGSRDAARRANAQWKRQLEHYEDPGLDTAVDDALQAYIAKRKASMPDKNYF